MKANMQRKAIMTTGDNRAPFSSLYELALVHMLRSCDYSGFIKMDYCLERVGVFSFSLVKILLIFPQLDF